MKIMLGNNCFSQIGGAEVMLYSQYQLLKEHDNEVVIFATDRKPYFETDGLLEEYFPKSINYSNLHGFDKIKYITKRYYNIEAENKLDAFLKKTKPDIAHFGNIKSGLTPSVLKACYNNSVPVVITLHDAALFCPNAVLRLNGKNYCKDELCVSGNYTHCITNKCRSNSYYKSVNAFIELALNKVHKLYDGVDAFVTPSQALKDLAIKSGISEERVKVIPNFVADSYLKAPVNYEKGEYFLYVGRIGEEKGLSYVIDAFAQLPSEIKFRIVGTGPQKEELEKKVKDLSLTNIEFAGYKSGDDLLKEYQNCIATILPCNWFECFGLTIVESFAYGKPVIGSNLGGIPETVVPNETGILIEPGSVEDIVNAVKKLYYDEAYLKELSYNCKNKSEKYSKENYYNEIMKLFNDILKKRSKK